MILCSASTFTPNFSIPFTTRFFIHPIVTYHLSSHHFSHKPLLHTNFPHNIFYRHNFSHIILSHTLHYTILFMYLFHTPSFTIPCFTMYSLSHTIFSIPFIYTILSHTIFDPLLCYTPLITTPSLIQLFSHRRSFTSRFFKTFLIPLHNIFHTM